MAKFEIVDDQGDVLSVAPDRVFTSLDAATADTEGAVIDFGGTVNFATVVAATTGDPTDGTVKIMMSIDGVTFVDSLSDITLSSTPDCGFIRAAFRYLRCDLTGLTTGTAPTVTAKALASI